MSVATLAYRITADSTSLGRELRFAERDVKRLSRRAESDFRKIGRAAGIMTAAVVTGLGAMAKRQIDVAADMDALSRSTGIAIEELSAMSHVARETDADFGTAEYGLQRLNREIAAAVTEGEEASSAFGDMGIALRDQVTGEARGTLEVLGDIADQVANASNEFEQTAIATEFFGNRIGQDLLPMLQEGSEGIEELIEEADRLGFTIDEQMGRQAQEFQRNMRRVQNSLAGVTRNIAGQALPAVNDMLHVWEGLTDSMGDTSDIEEAEDAMGSLEKTLRGIFAAVEMVRIGANVAAEALVGMALAPVAVGADIGTRASIRGALRDFADLDENVQMAADSLSQMAVGMNITDILEGEVDESADHFQRHLDNVMGNIEDHYNQGGRNLERILDGVDDMLDERNKDISEKTENAWDGASSAVDDATQEMETAAERWRRETEDEFTRHMMDLAEVQELYDGEFLSTIEFERATDLINERVAALDDTVDHHLEHLERVADRWQRNTRTSFELYEETLDDLIEAHQRDLIDRDTLEEAHRQLWQLHDPLGAIAEQDAFEQMAEQARQVRAEINGVDLMLEAHLESLRELRDEGLLTYEEYRMAIDQAKGSTGDLEDSTSQLFDLVEAGAHELSDNIIDAIVNPFEASMSEIMKMWVQTMTRMALQESAQRILGAAFSAGGEVQSFNTGGAVSGPGTSTSDSILARLSDGEYVVNAKSTRHYGVGFMEAVNQRKLPKYATGGLVGSGGGGGGAAGGGGPITVQVVIDGQIVQQQVVNTIRNTPDGRRAVVDVSAKGARRVP